MRFATSCSKTLIRSDWRRFWPVGFLYALISFFMLPLSLEEIFIYELGGEDHAIKNILL